MRVLQAMAGARHGGAEAFFERLVPALSRAGLEQRVVIRRDPARAAHFRGHGFEPVEVPFGGFLDFKTGGGIRAAIAAFKPDVVMTWMSRASALCPAGDFVQVGRLGGYYDLKYYRRCRHLIGNTEDIRAYMVKSGWPAERAHYLPNFVDAKPQPPASRADNRTPEDVPLLLALGRLHRNKAFDVLLSALVTVPRAHLWIAGEGPEREVLMVQAKREGVGARVHFLGWRRDIAALIAASDVLVVPSRHEPLGNVVIEGWAHSRAVVASASAGPGALVRDGQSGLVVPVGDARALAAALNRAIGDKALRDHLALGGRKAYEAEFTERAVVARYLDFFEKVSR